MPKEFFTYQQQMEKLRSSGLAIEDEEACCRVLADIGYFPVVNGYHRFPRPEHPGIPRRRHFWDDVFARLEKIFSDRRCVRQLSRAKGNWLELPAGKVTAGILSEAKKFMTKR